MADEAKNINPVIQQTPTQGEVVQSWQLPSQVTDILNKANSGVDDIVRIKELEWKETWLLSWIYYWVINRFNAALGITLDPTVFAEMTDTLNKHRHILEMNSADNYPLETNKAA